MIRSHLLTATVLLIAQLACSSASKTSNSNGAGGPVPGCTQSGTYWPTAERSTGDPGTCPLDAELPIEWAEIVVESTDRLCGSDRIEGSGEVTSSSGDHCAYEDTLEITAYTTELRGVHRIAVQNCTYVGGLTCTANYTLRYTTTPPDDSPDAGL